MIPYAIESLQRIKPLEPTCFAHVERLKHGRYHVTLTNPLGEALLMMREVTARPLEDPLQNFFYKPTWQSIPASKPAPDQAVAPDLMILGDQQQALAAPLKTIFPLSKRASIGDANKPTYADEHLDITDPKAIVETLASLCPSQSVSAGPKPKPWVIYFLGGFATAPSLQNSWPHLPKLEEGAVLGLFHFLKALQDAIPEDITVEIRILLNRCAGIHPEDEIHPFGSSLIGLAKSAAAEFTQFKLGLFDLDLKETPETSEISQAFQVVAGQPFAESGFHRAFRKGTWFKKSLIPTTLKPASKAAFRQGGRYFIVGGHRGIGLALSQYLAQNFNAQLIWVGRSTQNDSIEKAIDQIQALGGKAAYFCCDVADQSGLSTVVNQAVDELGPINGAVHSALVLKDSSLMRMREETLLEVLSPKMHGIFALNQALANQPLDFLMIFSAGQSFACHAGQANYAAASTFIDHFSLYLKRHHQRPIKIINWGYWGDIGIVATDFYRKKMAAQGSGSIQSWEGMEAICRMLASDEPQCLAVKAETSLLKKLGVSFEAQPQLPNLQRPSMPDDKALQQFHQSYERLEAGLPTRLLAVFQEMGIFNQTSEAHSLTTLAAHIQLHQDHTRLFAALVAILVKAGLVTEHPADGSYSLASQPVPLNPPDFCMEDPHINAHARLAQTCLAQYSALLQGHLAATQVMFPQGQTQLVEGIYAKNPASDYYNYQLGHALSDYVVSLLDQQTDPRPIQLLEVGAGTGATAQIVAQVLAPFGDRIQYTYTDIAPSFLQRGKGLDLLPETQFKRLDLEAHPTMQGFPEGSFDAVIACNVVHATAEIEQSLEHLAFLLKPQGRLFLNEATEHRHFATLTFGLLKGWWAFRDIQWRMEHSPLLSVESWQTLLARKNFDQLRTLAMNGPPKGPGQHVFIGVNTRVPKFQPVNQYSRGVAPVSPSLAAKISMAKAVEDRVKQSIAQVLGVQAGCIDEDRAFSDYGLDSISSLDLINVVNDDLGIVLKTTTLFDYPSVTEFAQFLRDHHSDALQTPAASQEPLAISTPQVTESRRPPEPDHSTFSQTFQSEEPLVEDPIVGAESGGFQALLLEKPGHPGSLALKNMAVLKPGPDQVQIQICAASLNFGDLLCVKGLYPNMPTYPFTPGSELAGVIVEVGTKVTRFAPGDEVIALTGPDLGAHALRVNCPQQWVVAKPKSASFEEASAFPIVFLTMHHAFQLARVRPGETVLIQTAAGGTGLMAVQMALQAGAEIFATAGSEAKLAHLRNMGVHHGINYRQIDFEEAIHQMGKAIDVVINTLAGDALQKGLRLLAPGGRYLEIAMTGMKSARAVDLSMLVDNQAFFSIDMSRLRAKQPKLFAEYLETMATTLAEGTIRPCISHTWDFSQIRDAYHCLENRANIGKVVLRMNSTERTIRPVETPLEAKPKQPLQQEPIAVIGMAGRFPGAPNLQAFWENLAQGVCSVGEVPKNRWDLQNHFHSDANRLDKTYCRWGGFLDDIEWFDPSFFNISGVEARQMDPQQRIFLETCWQTLEHAGYAHRRHEEEVGVFVGGCQGDYLAKMEDHQVLPGIQSYWGNAGSVLPARISYFLNLKGPSIAVDTACSSSLVAIHLACQSILSGDCKLALAGGIFTATTPRFFIASSNAGMLSADGVCRAFDQDANGFVPGEGSGAILLKKLSDALRDGDSIHGVIKGSAVNQDGKTNGLTAPSSKSQTEVIQAAQRRAGVTPDSISYVETHGTGTKLGDPIEMAGLIGAFKTSSNRESACRIGSVKTNIGHAATAAGIAGVLKVLLSLQNQTLPASLHFKRNNEQIQLDDTCFLLNDQPHPWPQKVVGPRRAGVSSFGFSGTNGHLIIEEAPQRLQRTPEPQDHYLIAISASSARNLKQLAGNLAHWLEAQGASVSLGHIAFTLLQGRHHFRFRHAFVVKDKATLIKCLQDCQKGILAPVDIKKPSLNPAEPSQLTPLLEELPRNWSADQLQKLADSYCADQTLPWSALYADAGYGRIPMPGHPFNPAYFGLPTQDQTESTKENSVDHADAQQPIFFKPNWQASPLPPQKSAPSTPRVLLVFSGTPAWIQALKQAYPKAQLIWVSLDQAQKHHPDPFFILDPKEPSSLATLFAKLGHRRWVPDAMVHLDAFHQDANLTLCDRLQRAPRLLLELSQKIMRGAFGHQGVRIPLIVACPEAKQSPIHAGIAGMLRSLRKEQPQLRWKSLTLSAEVQPTTIAATLWQEANHPDIDVIYHQQQRGQTVFQEASLTKPSPAFLRKDGIYLVTGGHGGLGRIFCKALADHGAGTLIIASRSKPDSRRENELADLRESGCRIVTIPTDLGDQAQVRAMMDQVLALFGSLHGILHCAGGLADGFALTKSWQDMASVLAPKVQGTHLLDQATQAIKLDFFCVFSSLTAITGNPGQTDYAFANGFLRGFARWRNHQVERGQRWGTTLAIDWPLWQEGTMMAKDFDEATLFAETGLQPMPSRCGLSAWFSAMQKAQAQDLSQVAITFGDVKKISNLLNDKGQDQLETTVPVEKTMRVSAQNYHQSAGLAFLRQTISKLVGLPLDQIDPDSSYEDFGIDSLMVKAFNQAIAPQFSQPLSQTLLYEWPTLRDLAQHLAEAYAEDLAKLSPSVTEPEVAITPDSGVESARQQTQPGREQEIAIIGLHGRYPEASNPDIFWQNLLAGRDSVGEIPTSRWSIGDFYHPDATAASQGKSYCKWGGFLEKVTHFDAGFFNISPREAIAMDPQERLFLEVAWATLEDAGYPPGPLRTRLGKLKPHRTGVFVGVTTQAYGLLALEHWHTTGSAISTNPAWSIANRVSYTFNFTGPSMPVDTACSSSLMAIHLACESLANGSCETALAGGVNLYLHPLKYAGMAGNRMLSPTGKCHTFGPGDGFVPGEGVGAVLLKPLAKALEDGDHVYGVILGSSINHGGKTSGYTVPNPNAQAALIEDALEKADICPETIGFVEAHGTGTELGDPIEIAGLTKAFRSQTDQRHFCAIGSVKAQIGHLEAAAGIAGLTRVLLQLKHGTISPAQHAYPTNPNLDLASSPFVIPEKAIPWPKPDSATPRRAAISSFGAGGANAHLIIEESVQPASRSSSSPEVILLSATTPEQLHQQAENLLSFLQKNSQTSTRDSSEVLQQIRLLFAEILAIPAQALDPDDTWTDFGLSPVDGQTLLDAINAHFQTQFRHELWLNHASLNQLAQAVATGLEKMDPKQNQIVREEIPLANIAHTLQVGRVALEERVAWVVSTHQQLQQSLSQFLAKDFRNCFRGCCHQIEALPVDALIQKLSPQDLAQAWVTGTHIPWSELPREQPPRRISLPTYPFAGKSFMLGRPASKPLGLDRSLPTPSQPVSQPKMPFFYQTHWVAHPQALPKPFSEPTRSQSGIIILVAPEFHPSTAALRKSYSPQAEVMLVPRGKANGISTPRKGLSLPESLVAYLAERKTVRGIHFLGMPENPFLPDPHQTFAETTAMLKELLDLVQALQHNRYDLSRLFLQVISENAFAIAEDDAVHPGQASLHGFCRSLAKECPKWQIHHVDVSRNQPFPVEQLVALAQTRPDWRTPDVALRGGRRLVRKLKTLEFSPTEPSPLRQGGVYLITGGGGGIGLVTAEFLSKAFGAKVMLLGRSQPSKALTQRIRAFSQLGGEVAYLPTDITDTQALENAIAQTQSRFGIIHGVFHGAMVYGETDLQHMAFQDLEAIAAPKMKGSLTLFQALQPHSLDFIVFFSSGQSLLANPKRAHYAAASCFQDAFAHHLSQAVNYPVKVINWGFFNAGHMPQDQLDSLAKQGVQPLTPEDGTEAIQVLLNQPLRQMLALRVAPEVLEMMGVDTSDEDAKTDAYSNHLAELDQTTEPQFALAPYHQAFADLGTYSRNLLRTTLKKMGAGDHAEAWLDKAPASFSKAYEPLKSALMTMLAEQPANLPVLNNRQLCLQADTLLEKHAFLKPHLALLHASMERFPEIISGQIPATAILFPQGSNHLVANIYKNNPVVDFFNQAVANQVTQLISQAKPLDGPFRILEVGAGTGATSAAIFPALNQLETPVRYRYTDLSPAMIKHGRSHFKWPFIDFAVLDIERQPEAQGFEHASFDLVVAANVLHASQNLDRVLTHVKALLKPNGHLLLNEATAIHPFATLTFGLLDGWWLFKDGQNRLPGSPLASEPQWCQLLKSHGFKHLESFGSVQEAGFGQHVIAAQNDGQKTRPDQPHLSRSETVSPRLAPPKPKRSETFAAITNVITEILRDVLMAEDAHFGEDDPFVEMGVDSIMSVEIITKLNAALHIELRSTDLFNYVNMHQLTAHIAQMARIPALNPEPEHVSQAGPILSTNNPENDGIAIVGHAGRFPQAHDMATFWQNLRNGVDCITPLPQDRWAPTGLDMQGGFLSNIDRFDPLFFKISPKEAPWIEPQQRIILEIAWQAFEHAGYALPELSQAKCGVFIGGTRCDYLDQLPGGTHAYSLTSNSFSVLAARIAYLFDLKGPCLSIDTACSSSLVAIALACDSLRTGKSDIALAGGVSLMTSAQNHELLAKTGMLSPSRRCKTFANGADGIVPAEAVGAIVLKPLSKALRDRDTIHGVIRGYGTNHDGRTNGITAPNGMSQAKLLQDIYGDFRIDPQTIGYVEAHGTGTHLGDPIELHALGDVYSDFKVPQGSCPIGSVKTNMGHALEASGMASIAKLIHCLEAGELVPSLHFKEENPHINWAQSPFYVNTELRPWPQADHPRRAVTSAFGMSGTNAHLILEQAPQQTPVSHPNSQFLFPLSAKTKDALARRVEDLAEWLAGPGQGFSLGDMAFTLSVGRSHFRHRAVFIASDPLELKRQLDAWQSEMTGSFQAPDMASTETLLQMARSFLQGESLIPEALFPQGGQRIPMPFYRFAGQRYWHTDIATEAISAAAKRHPVLGENQSTFGEIRFETRFDQNDFFLAEHQWDGKLILPGVVCLEMAHAANRLAGGAPASIQHVVWRRPLVAIEGILDVAIILKVKAAHIEFELHHLGLAPKDQLAARGRLVPQETAGDQPKSWQTLQALQQAASTAIDPAFIYEQARSAGFVHGPRLQVLRRMQRVPNGIFAQLELAKEDRQQLASFDFHPALMDGAIQTVIGLILNEPKGSHSYAPYSLGTLRQFKPLTSPCFVHAVATEKQLPGAPSFHVHIMNDSGETLVTMRDFTLKGRGNTEVPPQSQSWEYLLAVPFWQQHQPSAKAEIAGPMLIFSNRSDWVQAFPNLSLVLVKPGSVFRETAEGFEMNLTRSADFESLLQRLASLGKSPKTILYSLSRDPFPKDSRDVAVQLEQSLYAMFRLCKALLAQPNLSSCNLLYLFGLENGAISPIYAAMAAWCATVNLESQHLHCRSVEIRCDYGQVPTAQELRIIVSGALACEPGNAALTSFPALRWQASPAAPSGIFESRAFRKAAGPSDSELPLRPGGTYLITGGLGGLGWIFAQHLAKTVKANLCLVGRSELTPKTRKMIEELRALGSDVHYESADVSDEAQVKRVIQLVASKFSHLHGIFHAAGILRDCLLPEKTEKQMEAVLAAKVFGTLHLDRETRHLALDWFGLCSSITALCGNLGQSDYGYANSFLDHFATYRESLRAAGRCQGLTLSVNWPLWQDGGMTMDTKTQDVLARRMGMVPLPGEKGCQMFFESLALQSQQCIGLYGDIEKLTEFMGIQDPAIATPLPPAEPKTESSTNTRSQAEITEILLREISTFLAIEKEALELNERFFDYGFDSITLAEFADQLNEAYDLEIMPSDFFEHTTLQAFADHLATILKPPTEPVRLSVDPPTPEVAPPAHLTSRETSRPDPIPKEVPSDAFPSHAVAIIGISGRMPGSTDLENFADHLFAGRNLIRRVPQERWSNDANEARAWGSFLNDLDCFDSLFFQISPAEAQVMDPQQRLFLEDAWKAIEDAGYAPSSFAGSNTGLFVGVSSYDFAHLLTKTPGGHDALATTGLSHAVLANRVSYALDLRGPSEAIDTACSSAAVALHRAMRALEQGECDTALVGAVNALLLSDGFDAFDQLGVLSNDGKVRTFDESAHGYVRGEGVGAVLLKPLDQARVDGDAIYGVLLGSAVNHTGRGFSLTAPNPHAQAEAMIQAMQKANIEPRDLDYIEAQGTGTPIGDAVEIKAFKHAFAAFPDHDDIPSQASCGIGSLKPNIGHLEAASSMAALFKILFAFQRQALPGLAHFERINPSLKLEGSPFHLTTEAQPWPQRENQQGAYKPRRAGLNSFGFGGTNAHLILQEPPLRAPRSEPASGPTIIVLSARDEEDLAATAAQLLAHLVRGTDQESSLWLQDLAYTLAVGRDAMPARAAFVIDHKTQLVECLTRYVQSKTETDPRAFRGHAGQQPAAAALKGTDPFYLASSWVEGSDIDWAAYFDGSQAQRIHLPTYPFKKQQHSLMQASPKLKEQTISQIAEIPTQDTNQADSQVAPQLAETLAKLLGVSGEAVREANHLKQIGFNSMIAIQLNNRIFDRWQIRLATADLFSECSHRGITKQIEHRLGQAQEPSSIAEPSRIEVQSYALSESQRGIWAICEAYPDHAAYHIPLAFHLPDRPKIEILEKALNALAQRHPSMLASVQLVDGKPVQTIHPNRRLSLETFKVKGMDDTALAQHLMEKGRQSFDLTNDTLVRAQLYIRPNCDPVLFLTLHHLIFDGGSVAILLEELPQFYIAELKQTQPILGALDAHYGDFVAWEQAMLCHVDAEQTRAYWHQQLGAPLPILSLPCDKSRPPIQTHQGRSYHFQAPATVVQALDDLSVSQDVSIYSVWLSAYFIMLHQLSGNTDLLVGSPMFARPASHFEKMIGNFVNMVVLRAKIKPNMSPHLLVKQVQETVLKAMDHATYPFTHLARELDYPRDPSHPPVFQQAFTYQNSKRGSEPSVAEGSLNLIPLPGVHPENARDLTLEVIEDPHALIFKYNPDLFNLATIRQLAQNFILIVEVITQEPQTPIAQLPWGNTSEQIKLLQKPGSSRARAVSAKAIHRLFERSAARTPQRTALFCAGEAWTYSEINQQANQLAHHLIKVGVQRDQIVAVCLGRSPAMVVAILAILKAGGAWLAIEPNTPEARTTFYLDHAKVQHVLTQKTWAEMFTESLQNVLCLDSPKAWMKEPLTNPRIQIRPQQLAYVVYTSGSTGTPKGVMVPHGNLCHYVRALQAELKLNSEDGYLHTASFAFSSSVRQLFLPLSQGIRLILATQDQISEPSQLLQLVQQAQVTVMDLVPSYTRLVLAEMVMYQKTHRRSPLAMVRHFLSASETFPADLASGVQDFLENGHVTNMFGQTETTGIATTHPLEVIDAQASLPLGRPLLRTRVYILNRNLQPVAPCVVGQLYLAGPGLARGYLDDPRQTAQKFLPDPFSAKPGGVMYNTGDRVRLRADGTLEHMGRSDHQVKIRGFRIELEDIEAALLQCGTVQEAAVQLAKGPHGDPALVAFVAMKPNQVLDPGQLRAQLKQALPHYMIPSLFMALDHLPRTTSGKLDRKHLPQPKWASLSAPQRDCETAYERLLADIFNRVLGLKTSHPEANLFELGSNSLLNLQIVQQIRDKGFSIKIRDLYLHQSVASLAAFFEQRDQATTVKLN